MLIRLPDSVHTNKKAVLRKLQEIGTRSQPHSLTHFTALCFVQDTIAAQYGAGYSCSKTFQTTSPLSQHCSVIGTVHKRRAAHAPRTPQCASNHLQAGTRLASVQAGLLYGYLLQSLERMHLPDGQAGELTVRRLVNCDVDTRAGCFLRNVDQRSPVPELIDEKSEQRECTTLEL